MELRVCKIESRVWEGELKEREVEGWLGSRRWSVEAERSGDREEKKSLKEKREDEREGKAKRIFDVARMEVM